MAKKAPVAKKQTPEGNQQLVDAIVTVKHLQLYLDEVPAERFQSPFKLADVPRLFTVETFCKLVARGLRAGDS